MFLADKIKKYILEHGLKIGVVAEKSGISFQTFSAMLNGNRKILAEEYFKICEVLGVPLETFVAREGAYE